METAIADFSAITGSTTQVATHFLSMTDGDAEQAIQLFFDSPDLGAAMATEVASAPPQPTAIPSSRNVNQGRIDSGGVINLDSSDDDAMDEDDDDYSSTAPPTYSPELLTRNTRSSAAAASAPSATIGDYEDDEAMARRMQEELYAGGDMAGDYNESVRAPMARTTETLVGPGADWTADDMHEAVLQQMRARARPPRIINDSFQPTIRKFNLDLGRVYSESKSRWWERRGWNIQSCQTRRIVSSTIRANKKNTMDDARQEGKDEEKWILVNVQDPSIFDCQSLNRDIWKDEGVRDTVKENFIFMQYDKNDPRGSQYIQYYFPLRDSRAAYPHIAIVDPRTGEQVKVWSGPPVPKASDFMMQLHEFLDRYSLNAAAKNPVAKRKPDKPVAVNVDRLTEEEMLNLALQNSLANGETDPRESDPDDLTKSVGDLGKGKGKEIEDDLIEDVNGSTSEQAADSPFRAISLTNPHTEPANNPATSTRIQFRHSGGRVIRRFEITDPVRRIYEWLKAEPMTGKEGMDFELKSMGKDLIDSLDSTIDDAGLKNGTVMVEYLEA